MNKKKLDKKKKLMIVGGVVGLLVIIIVIIILIPKPKKIEYEVVVDVGTLNNINVNKSRTRKNEIVKYKDSYFLVIHESEQQKYFTLEVESVSTTKEDIKVVVKKVAGILETGSNPKAIIKLDRKPKKIEIIYR